MARFAMAKFISFSGGVVFGYAGRDGELVIDDWRVGGQDHHHPWRMI